MTDPFWHLEGDGFVLRLVRWTEHRDGPPAEAEGTVTLPDGARHYVVFMTTGRIEEYMRQARSAGENGYHFVWHDLVIIAEPGFDCMVKAVSALIAEGKLDSFCDRIDPDDAS